MTKLDGVQSSIFNKQQGRIGLFLVTMLLFLLVMPLADTAACDYLIFDYGTYLHDLLRHPVVLFGVLGPAGFFAGWLIYSTISILAIRFHGTGRVFWRLYTVFAVLLAVNIGFLLIFTLSFGRSFGYIC